MGTGSAAAALAAGALLSGCAGGGFDAGGGLHELLEHGVHVTLITIPSEQLWNRVGPVMPGADRKIGAPPP